MELKARLTAHIAACMSMVKTEDDKDKCIHVYEVPSCQSIIVFYKIKKLQFGSQPNCFWIKILLNRALVRENLKLLQHSRKGILRYKRDMLKKK